MKSIFHFVTLLYIILFYVSCSANEHNISKANQDFKKEISKSIEGVWITEGMFKNINDSIVRFKWDADEGISIRFDTSTMDLEVILFSFEFKKNYNIKIDSLSKLNNEIALYSSNIRVLKLDLKTGFLEIEKRYVNSPTTDDILRFLKFSNNILNVQSLKWFIFKTSLLNHEYLIKFPNLNVAQPLTFFKRTDYYDIMKYGNGKFLLLNFYRFIITPFKEKRTIMLISSQNKYLYTKPYIAIFKQNGYIDFYESSSAEINKEIINYNSDSLSFTLIPR